MLVVVGDGPERQSLEVLATRLCIAEHVRFCGEIRDAAAVCPFFLTASVFALPGSGGLAIYHAIAYGVPVVATRADGTERDLVREGSTGFLCEPGDVEALEDRIVRILGLPSNEWLELSRRCSDFAREDMHVGKMVEALKSAAVDAVARSRRRVDSVAESISST